MIEKDPEEWKEQKSHIKESYLAMQQQHDEIQQELEDRKPGQDTILEGKDPSVSFGRSCQRFQIWKFFLSVILYSLLFCN